MDESWLSGDTLSLSLSLSLFLSSLSSSVSKKLAERGSYLTIRYTNNQISQEGMMKLFIIIHGPFIILSRGSYRKYIIQYRYR